MLSGIDRDIVIDAIGRRATTATSVIAAAASRGRPTLTTREKRRGRVTAASSFNCEKGEYMELCRTLNRTNDFR